MKYVTATAFLALAFAMALPATNAQEYESQPVDGPIRLLPDVKTVPIKFHPTRAQKKFPRVRAAREKRTEDIRVLFQKANVDYPAEEVLLRIFKHDDALGLWVRPQNKRMFVFLKSYDICMRSGVLGPKRQEGDYQVPEGYYQITKFDPDGAYHLSMLIGYPNKSDLIRTTNPKHPGGKIEIHGACCTIGCIPITDRWVEELYLICIDSHWMSGKMPWVHIFPTRMNEKGMTWLQKEFAEKPELLSFWKELQVGYGYFEMARILARFTVKKEGAYLFQDIP